MSVLLNTAKLKTKDANGNYVGSVNTIVDRTTSEIIADITAIGKSTVNTINSTKTSAESSINIAKTSAETNINNTKTSAETSINNTKNAALLQMENTANVLMEEFNLPTDYTELNEAIKKAQVSADSRIKKFYTNNLFANNVADSDDGTIRNLKVYGDSSQIQTTGKNLIPFIYKTRESQGVMYEVLDDGSVIATGTSTIQGGIALVRREDGYKIPIGTYTLSGCPSGGTKNTYHIRYWLYDSNDTQISYGDDFGSSVTFTTNQECSIQIFCRTEAGATVNGEVFKPQLEKGTVATSYETPCSGIASPNPTQPQMIHSVVNPTVDVTGSNLIPFLYYQMDVTVNGVRTRALEDGTVEIKGTLNKATNGYLCRITGTYTNTDHKMIPIEATKYKLSLNYVARNDSSVDKNVSIQFLYCDANLNQIGAAVYQTFPSELTIDNTTRGAKYLAVNLWHNSSGEYGYTFDRIVSFNLVKGDKALPYQKYEHVSAMLPITLNAIGNAKDYVDVERKCIVRKIKEYTATGTESCQASTTNDSATSKCYRISNVAVGYNTTTQAITSDMFHCNNYLNATAGLKYFGGLLCTSGHIYVSVDTSITDAAEFKTWLDTNKPTFYFELAEPVIEPLTDLQLADFMALRSYYPATNLSVISDEIYGTAEFEYPCNIANTVEYVKAQMNDERQFVYDMQTIADEAYINAQYSEILAEMALE